MTPGEEAGAAVIKESASESDILLLKMRLAEAEATMKASEQRLVDAESKPAIFRHVLMRLKRH